MQLKECADAPLDYKTFAWFLAVVGGYRTGCPKPWLRVGTGNGWRRLAILRPMRTLAYLSAPILLLSTLLHAQVSLPPTHFIGGRWFNGTSFAVTDFYVADGRLTHRKPEGAVATVDLHGGYVVPPFGDAHEHYFDSVGQAPELTQQYLRDGIFYAQGVTDIASGAARVVAAGLVNTPTTVDVTYAHGGITAPNGHPKEIYEQYALGFYTYPITAEQKAQILASHLRLNDAYWEVDSAETLAKMWPRILAGKPDLIKVYLLHSETYAQQDNAHPPLAKGLNPALVPLIVQLAHAAGLKVAAHIDTAADFHVAVLAGVDEMSHMPGYYVADEEEYARCRLADADIAQAARQHVRVIATAGLEIDDAKPAEVARIRRSQVDNLTRLKAAGISVLMGSDHYGHDTLQEARWMKALGVYSNLELLRMYAVQTPQDIFPRRKVGELREGFEASFLVLRANPLDDWKAIEDISDRWKGGHHLELPPVFLPGKAEQKP